MKNVKILKVMSLVALSAVLFGLSSCETTSSTDTSSGDTTQNSESSQSQSETSAGTTTSGTSESTTVQEQVIESITAKSPEISMTISETYYIPTNYTINPVKGVSLTSKQKQCTYVISDESIAVISGKTSIQPVALGTVTVTVISTIDESKTCSFTVTIKDEYFSRSISQYSTADDFSHELIEDGGYVITKGGTTDHLYVRDVYSTKWYMKTKINITSISSGENYPKFGLGTCDPIANNQNFYFFNAGPASAGSWNKAGVVEVNGFTNWAWNPGVPDSMARHKDNLYTIPTAIGLGTDFTMEYARDGSRYYMWFNNIYIGAFDTLADIIPAETPSYPGLFEFNSVVKFSEYEATADATTIDAKLATITDLKLISTWDADAS